MANIATLPVVDQTATDGYLFSTRTTNHMAKAGKGQTEMALGIISWHVENPQFSKFNSAFIGNGSAHGKDRAITMNGTVKADFAKKYKCSEQLVSLSYSCVVSTLQDMTDSAMNELMAVTPSYLEGKKTIGGFVSFNYKAILEATKKKADPLVFAIKSETSATTEDQTVEKRVASAMQGIDRAVTLLSEVNQRDDVKNGEVVKGGIKLKIKNPDTGNRETVRSDDGLSPDQIRQIADMATEILMALPAGYDLNDMEKSPSSRLTPEVQLDFAKKS